MFDKEFMLSGKASKMYVKKCSTSKNARRYAIYSK